MSSSDEDYLSEKFLVDAPSAPSGTYSSLRKRARQEADRRNAENKQKSRRQLEEEARAEGLQKSLFQRAQEETSFDHGTPNKAMAMMLKMGFKPGQALGTEVTAEVENSDNAAAPSRLGHRTEPIGIKMWKGWSRAVASSIGH
jgi:hypothetical protein